MQRSFPIMGSCPTKWWFGHLITRVRRHANTIDFLPYYSRCRCHWRARMWWRSHSLRLLTAPWVQKSWSKCQHIWVNIIMCLLMAKHKVSSDDDTRQTAWPSNAAARDDTSYLLGFVAFLPTKRNNNQFKHCHVNLLTESWVVINLQNPENNETSTARRVKITTMVKRDNSIVCLVFNLIVLSSLELWD